MSQKRRKKIIVIFHCAGAESEDEYLATKRGNIWTTIPDEDDHSYKFDARTGECLNDNTYAGCRRTLKLDFGDAR